MIGAVGSAGSEAEVFSANRAEGRIALTLSHALGRTIRKRVHESGSLRVRFPNASAVPEAVVVNTGGGMTGGDRFSIDIALHQGAQLVAGTAAAEKVYRSTGADAELDVRLSIAAEARLAWMPQETILFNAARASRRIDVDLASGGALLMSEAIVFGRTAMGEAVEEGSWRDRWRIRIGGRLAFAENVRIDGAVAARLAQPAVAAGRIAVATVFIAPADEGIAARLRDVDFAGEAAASAWNGFAVARFCASDGAALRHDVMAAMAALGQPVPRLWLQ